jgi:hypothetical protein
VAEAFYYQQSQGVMGPGFGRDDSR